MINCDNNGSIVVNANNCSYKLSNSDDYTDFLLWLTSPNPADSIDGSAFEVDESVPEEHRELAQRYAEFLTEFAEIRAERLSSKGEGSGYDQLKSRVNELISSFKGDAS